MLVLIEQLKTALCSNDWLAFVADLRRTHLTPLGYASVVSITVIIVITFISICMQVRVAMLSEVPTKLPLTLKAYVLSKDSLNSLEQWHPADHIVTEAVAGGEVQQTVACSEGAAAGATPGACGVGPGEGEAAGLLGGVADFVFRGAILPQGSC